MERREVLKTVAATIAGAISGAALGAEHDHQHDHAGLIAASGACLKTGEACLAHCLYLRQSPCLGDTFVERLAHRGHGFFMRSDESSCYSRPDSTTRPGTPSATPGTRSASRSGERAGVPLIGLRLSRGVVRERQSAGRFRRSSAYRAAALGAERRPQYGEAGCLPVAAVWEPQALGPVLGRCSRSWRSIPTATPADQVSVTGNVVRLLDSETCP